MSAYPPPPSQPPPPSLPRSTAGFHLRRELGRGGMGVVYEAQEIATGRTVALKVLLQELSLSGEAMERFQREARLAAAISHAHCVFVYGAHTIEGAPAIAMELIGGETLEDKIRRGEPIPVQTAVRWTIDLLEGLEAAHRAGVLHRDVKPSNCFVTTDGRVKVGDFGLSRSLERDVQLTQSGQFLGSPLYASPEQIRGRAYDVRSDMYSCGATLYAILTGRPPFAGGNVGEVLARILSEDPPQPRTLRPEISRGRETVVARAMERDPEERYKDLHEFRRALAPFAATRHETAAPWRRFCAYIVIDTVVMIFVTLAAAGATGWNIARLETASWHLFSALIPFTYFSLGEGLLGTSLGKWIFGMRVVASGSREPSLRGATLRALVFMGPSVLAGTAIAYAYRGHEHDAAGWQPLVAVAWFLILVSTARRRNGWRGLHELASDTLVIPVNLPFLRARYQAPPPEMELQNVPGLPARMGDYAVEGVIGSTPSGSMIKGRDATLERSVWIHCPRGPGALAGEGRRSLSRPGRLRWLDCVRTPAGEADVFESPGGSSLPVFSARHGRLDWPNAQRILLALVEEIRAEEQKSEDLSAETFALEQVWIDRNWDVRLLDEPVGQGSFTGLPSVALVREAARALFVGRTSDAPLLPPDLPFHAEPAVARMIATDGGFEDLGAIRDALTRISAGPIAVQRRTRGAQLAINVLLPSTFLAVVIVAGLLLGAVVFKLRGVESMIGELSSGKMALMEKTDEADAPLLTDDQRRAREILLAEMTSSTFGQAFLNSLPEEERAIIEQARVRQTGFTSADLAWAEETVRAEQGRSGAERRSTKDPGGVVFKRKFPSVTGLVGVLLWGAIALPLAFLFRGGLTFTLFGIRVRDRRGRHASRLKCLLRCALAWAPLALGAWAVVLLTSQGQMLAATIVASLFGAAYLAAIVQAILDPARCVVDRWLGTRLVPR